MLPLAAFMAPDGVNAEAVATLVQTGVGMILAHLSSAVERPPLPEAVPKMVWRGIPDTPVELSELLDQISTLLKGSMNAAHPGFIGHMDSMPTTISMLADLIAAGINNNMLSVEMSPALSELETQLLREIARAFGLGDHAGGVLTSGGTLANLQALAVARNQAFSVLQTGLAAQAKRPVLFASESAHTSLQKAAMLLGLGTTAVIAVQTDANGRMDPEALEREIRQAQERGEAPFCIVATAGTTTTGNIDPLPDLQQIAKNHGLWFHVDAAYGGALIFSPTHCHRLIGIEAADSITWNPQKWGYVAKTCAMVLFREQAILAQAFRIPAPYMRPVEGVVNLGEIGVQGTRHADVLKLWLSLQHLGRRGYASLIDESYRLTQHLQDEIQARAFLTLATQPDTNVVCFRARPTSSPLADWDALNTSLQAFLLTNGRFFLSLPLYQGKRWLRAVLLNPYCTPALLSELGEHIDNFMTSDHGLQA